MDKMEQVIDLFVKVANQLGYEAARLWPQVVAITWAKSFFWLVADPLIIVGSIIAAITLVKKGQQAKAKSSNSGYYYDDTGWVMLQFFGSIGLLAVAVVAFIALPDALAGFLYPEATTVMRLIGK